MRFTMQPLAERLGFGRIAIDGGLPDDLKERIEGLYVVCQFDPDMNRQHHARQPDMVLWDNWRMLHCASGIAVGELRHMQRTTILGDYALGREARIAAPAGAPA